MFEAPDVLLWKAEGFSSSLDVLGLLITIDLYLLNRFFPADPDPGGGKINQQNFNKLRNIMFWNAVCYLLIRIRTDL